jgi:prepilin-type N-terminal cleavage/methylation domain-containing protein
MFRLKSRGGRQAFTLLESVAVLAIFGLSASLVWPAVSNSISATELRLATGEVAAAFYEARIYALRQSANVAVLFESGPHGVSWALYRDGDGDGVLKQDIQRGVDKLERGARRLEHFGSRIRFGFPPGMRPTEIGDPTRLISNLDDPLRFGNSNMASFSSRGTASPGTAYVTNGKDRLLAVRIGNMSGKVTLWEYDPEIRRWRRKG